MSIDYAGLTQAGISIDQESASPPTPSPCSRFSSADTLACMQRFCSGQSAGDAVQENGVYHCVKQFTPQGAPKRN